jgi:glycine cleavage system transcriptional repressor
MEKRVIFVLGPDRPGIIAAVSRTLCDAGCNLEDVSHTTLQGQFVGIFAAVLPAGTDTENLLSALEGRLLPLGMLVLLRPLPPAPPPTPGEPYVITTVGPDRPGLVAGIAEVLARHGANITNLKAFPREGNRRQDYVVFYEVDLPPSLDRHGFREELRRAAETLGLDLNLQHREIFEEVHRI